MAETPKPRKLTAEEAAAADTGAESPVAATDAAPSSSGPVRLAPPPFVGTFEVPGVATVTEDGVELDAAAAEKVRTAAAQSGITLREV